MTTIISPQEKEEKDHINFHHYIVRENYYYDFDNCFMFVKTAIFAA